MECTCIKSCLIPKYINAFVVREMTVAKKIGSDYSVAGSSSGHAIIYRRSTFHLEKHDRVYLHEKDKWGKRSVEYAHLTHRGTGQQVDFFNTHLCLCTENQLLGSAKTIVQTIKAHR